MPALKKKPTPDASFGSFLRLLRKRAHLTQRELGVATGYSEGHICRFERGQLPPDAATLNAVFVPALSMSQSPDDVARLIELAAEARGDDLTKVRITGSYTLSPARNSDIDSLARAFDWYLHHQPDAAARLAQSLVPMWWANGDHTLARNRLAEVLRAGGIDVTVERAALLLNHALFANEQSHFAEAQRNAEQALVIAQSLKRDDLVAQALQQLAWSAQHRNAHQDALALFMQAVALYRTLGQMGSVADCLLAMAHVATWHDESRDAGEVEAWLDEAERIARRLKLPQLLLWSRAARGERAQSAGHTQQALAIVDAALRDTPDARNERQLAWLRAQRGELLSDLGRFRAALSALEQAEKEFSRIGVADGKVAVAMHRAIVLRRQGKWAAARMALTDARECCVAQGHPFFELRCLLNLALLGRATGEDGLTQQAQGGVQALWPVLAVRTLRLNAEERAELTCIHTALAQSDSLI